MDAISQYGQFTEFMPHGMCYMWRWDMLILHVGSDLFIALAYFSIPAAMFVLLHNRPDIPRGIFMLFIAFITLCGLTHLTSIVVTWVPLYALEGVFKLATAIVSVITAVVLWPLIPKVIAMPSPTDLQQRNEQIKELNQKLEQRIGSLSTLAGGVAHDFNNLLTIIGGNAQLLASGSHDERESRSLAAIANAAQRAENLCRQMLAYSGRGHFLLNEVQLNRFLESIELHVAEHCQLRYSLGTSLHTISASEEQLEQLLQDVYNNAVEASTDGVSREGEITISTYNKELNQEQLIQAAIAHEAQAGEFVVLEVKDNGVGMTKEVAERLFDPYFSTKFSGRGLGLAAVEGIVRGHHGCLFVESSPQNGTTIQIAFPAIISETTQYRQPVNVKPKTVLVVDDEEEILRLASSYLEKLDIKVFTAADAESAMRLAEQHKDEIDAVILDYMMPDMTGVELLGRISKIITVDTYLSSGYSRGEIGDPDVRKLLTGFIAKPFSFEDYATIFGGQRSGSEEA
ncbi:MAG: ATP-binding protein [Pseudohongiellaceae bacterium]